MNPLWWDWKDRDWCPICQACPLVWQADRCSCCKVPWGDPYGKGKCKNRHQPTKEK